MQQIAENSIKRTTRSLPTTEDVEKNVELIFFGILGFAKKYTEVLSKEAPFSQKEEEGFIRLKIAGLLSKVDLQQKYQQKEPFDEAEKSAVKKVIIQIEKYGFKSSLPLEVFKRKEN